MEFVVPFRPTLHFITYVPESRVGDLERLSEPLDPVSLQVWYLLTCLKLLTLFHTLHFWTSLTIMDCRLVPSSLWSNRFQRVKIGENVSKWGRVKCGVPQGSLIGPGIFNIFINNLFYILEYCVLYNYADDNTASHSSEDVDELVCEVESELRNILKCFKTNCLGVNPDKLQFIILGKDASNVKHYIEDRTIYLSNDVKVLGVTIDKDLKFYEHVYDICCKAARQINVLSKLLSVLDQEAWLVIYRNVILSNLN